MLHQYPRAERPPTLSRRGTWPWRPVSGDESESQFAWPMPVWFASAEAGGGGETPRLTSATIAAIAAPTPSRIVDRAMACLPGDQRRCRRRRACAPERCSAENAFLPINDVYTGG